MAGAIEARGNRRLMTISFPLPTKLARKQQTTSVKKLHFAGVRHSWAVAIAVIRAIDAVAHEHEWLGKHLRNSITSGSVFSYDPERDPQWLI